MVRYVYIAGIAVLVGVYMMTTTSTEESIVHNDVQQELSKPKKVEKESTISFDDKEVKQNNNNQSKVEKDSEGLSKVAQILQKKKEELQSDEKPQEEAQVEPQITQSMSKADRAYEMIVEKNLREYNQNGYIGGESNHMVYTDFDPDEVVVNEDLPPSLPIMIKGKDMKGIPFEVPIDANLYKHAKANGKSIYIGVTGSSDLVEDLIPVSIGSSENDKKVAEMPPSPGSN
jgi:hypothetical protein